MILGIFFMLLFSVIVGDYTPAMISFPIFLYAAFGLAGLWYFITTYWYVVIAVIVLVIYIIIEDTRNKKQKLLMIEGILGIVFLSLIGSLILPSLLHH